MLAMALPSTVHGRRAGALVMALDADDAANASLNDTLLETERMMHPQLRATAPPSEPEQVVTSAAHSRALAAVREAMRGHRLRRPVSPISQSAPPPAPLSTQSVRLTNVPRDPRQSPVHSAAAMMRTWVLVNDPPPLPPFEERRRPRPPLAVPTCCICLDDKWPCEVAFTGCGHMNTCLPCAQTLVKTTGSETAPCPLCRVKSRPLLLRVG